MSERPSLRVVEPARPIAVAVQPVWQPDVDEPGWCVDATITGCSIGEREASTIPSAERRAALLTRGRERAQAVLARPDERAPTRQRRVAGVIGVSVAIHLIGFVLLAWFGAGVETRVARRGREPFTNERVIVPIQVPARAIEPELAPESEPEIEPAEPSSLPVKSRPRHAASPSAAAEPELAGPSEPSSYALPGFELSSEGALPGGSGPGHAWGGEGSGGGTSKAGDSGGLNVAPDVQAKPRGTVVEPDYPPELERRGIEGDAVVLVWLDEHGHVIKAEVVESSGYEAFDHNAEMAAQRQAWEPAMRGGVAIASKRRYRIRFKLPTQ